MRSAVLAAVAVAVAALGGCSGGDAAPEETPDGAVVLTQNVPQDVANASIVATNVDGDDVTLRVSVDGGTAKPQGTSEGSTVTIDGNEWRVEAVWSEGRSGDQPGAAAGRVMLVPGD